MTVNLEFTYCNSNDFAQETAQSRSLKKILLPCDIITSAEREVKVSQRSGMYQSCNFLTRLGKQTL